jgi:uncharacterized membrane protein
LFGVIVILLLSRFVSPYGGMYMMHNFSLYINLLVYLFGFLVVVAISYTLFLQNNRKSSPPLVELDKRLAEGKISLEEYEKIREVLKRSE